MLMVGCPPYKWLGENHAHSENGWLVVGQLGKILSKT